jgi:hypothetical protein
MDQAAILATLAALAKQIADLTALVQSQAVATQTPEAYYLANNPDVASHPWFKDHPKDHYDLIGKKEGRKSMWAATTTTVTPPPAPVATKYVYDADNMLISAKGVATQFHPVNGARMEPPIDADCPTGVVTPKGRVLSRPRADLGEMFMGYCQRISGQLHPEDPGLVIRALGGLVQSASPVFLKMGGYRADGSNWAEAADRIFHNVDYLTQEEIDAKARSDREWDAHWKKKEEERNKPAPVTPPVLPPAPPPEVEVPIE